MVHTKHLPAGSRVLEVQTSSGWIHMDPMWLLAVGCVAAAIIAQPGAIYACCVLFSEQQAVVGWDLGE